MSSQPQSRILHSCYFEQSRSGEQFIPEHFFGYIISGTMEVHDGTQLHNFKEGDFRLLTRNHLAKFAKIPADDGVFKSASVMLDQETLRNFSMEYGYVAEKNVPHESVVRLSNNVLYKNYADSIASYQDLNDAENKDIITLKVKELLLLLMKINPELKDVLFDFNEPGKVDLEAFMNRNFHFNVEMKRFAYLTGRSLATFKRDFEKIFSTSPNRWLQQRRLKEAYFLIKERGRRPSDVYLEVGFENLSHFSYSFKQMFGIAPSLV
jgi:AraC-type DNA-binding domain-containing proteins